MNTFDTAVTALLLVGVLLLLIKHRLDEHKKELGLRYFQWHGTKGTAF